MTRNGNEVKAENGRILFIEPTGVYTDYAILGNRLEYKDGQRLEYTLTEQNVHEGYMTNIDGEQRFVKASSYSELVSGLIRLRYSIDDELALMANSRVKSVSSEERQFQSWRKKCKEIARQLIND